MNKLGWRRELPSHLDYDEQTPVVRDMLRKLGSPPSIVPGRIDLRQWCSPIRDQGDLGSCTAHAGTSLIEYFERKAYGKHIDASRLFLYKATRNLIGETGDSGAEIRSTMGAMALFGVPPEKYWPYTDDANKFDIEPTAFCYSFAQNYQSLKYFRLDPPGTPGPVILQRIKAYLTQQIPIMFGFSVFKSIDRADDNGLVPYPYRNDSLEGGHAVTGVGLDESIVCPNATPGVLIFRNSWGPKWGVKGYGYLPYDYILKGLADDFWVLLSHEWIDTDQFVSA